MASCEPIGIRRRPICEATHQTSSIVLAALNTTCIFRSRRSDRRPESDSLRMKRSPVIRRVLFILGLAVVTSIQLANAQRPIETFDPFYHGEGARRSFFDLYAVTAEISYRPPGLLQKNEAPSGTALATGTDPLGLNLRFDYHLSSRLDLGFFIDAAGTTAGRSVSIRWVTLKYFQTQEAIDYAIRLAVDPSSDGRSGFPQMDLAFMYTSLVAPSVSNDFIIGIRRIQIGIQQLVSVDVPPLDPADPVFSKQPPDREVRRSRALGWEVHMSTGYNMLFDPAGSNAFVSLIAAGGRYDLVEWMVDAPMTDASNRTTTEFRGGVVWIRSGFQIERPGYRFSPFLSLPIKQWAPRSGDWPEARPSIGIRLMLR